MKVQCLEKVRDNSGNIKAYTLQDESGRVFQASGEQIKAEMKAKRYEFTNLQLDSIGRLIDKVDKNDIGRLHQEFEKAYQNLMSGKELGFGCIDIGSDFQNFDSNHSLVRVVDDHDDFREKYMTDIINQFEGYVLQKGGRIPYKLHVKSKDGVFEEVLYSLKDNMDMSVSDLINNLTEKNVKKELSNPKYHNAGNYMVRAYRLDCPHQLIQNIFIAPDMSKVAMNRQPINNQPNSGGTSNTVKNTNVNGSMSGIEFLKKFSLRRLQIKIKRFFLSNFFVSLLKK